MRFLLDTNVLIPLEPTESGEVESGTGNAIKLVNLANQFNHSLLVHPASFDDLSRDKNEVRRDLRRQLIAKYPRLQDPPEVPKPLEQIVGIAKNENERCDHEILAALYCDAIDLLITEDEKLRAKASRAGLGERVLSVHDAIAFIVDLSGENVLPPPAVQATVAHVIKNEDPILRSFRVDYKDKFDPWLKKCKREARQAWVIDGEDNWLAAMAIINPEDGVDPAWGKTLKICSFKVGEDYLGLKYGELLLKSIFEHGFGNDFETLFVTVFPKHTELIQLFTDFGFEITEDQTKLGELILAKTMRPISIPTGRGEALAFHIAHGPKHIAIHNDAYVIPIRPKYSDLLFPETAINPDLFHYEHPFGSAIRKAYLSHSGMKEIPTGSVVLFYRSQKNQGIIAVGVVEQTFRGNTLEEVARHVARRTVYSNKDLQEICEKEVLIVLFRQARILKPAISTDEAITNGVIKRAPQSISRISSEGVEWLRQRLIQ